jgi:hypothetical protein
MSGSQQWTYRFVLDERDFDAVEDALSYCLTLCQQGLASGTPLWTDAKDIKVIRDKLLSFFVPRERPQVALPLHLFYFQSRYGWQQFDIDLEEQNMMALDAMLLCYQAHCQVQVAAGADWKFRAHDQTIDTIRRRAWACPPTAG